MTGPDGLVLGEEAQALLFREARSCPEFTDEPVTDAQVAAVYDLVKYGPTSKNGQPLRILLVRGAAARARLLACLDGRNRARSTTAPLTVVLAVDRRFHERLPEVFPQAAGLRDVLEGLPRQRAREAEQNALLQVGYFIVGVRAAGLAAAPMTGFDAARVDREFFGDDGRHALVVMNLGRAAGVRHDRLPRLAYDDVVETA